ncbi:MAG TPA: PQQ-binding-like beta-propeller repeat protein, partial [Pirellulaceae bacterium]|nr:PQQ-binding-like beta-propeller repeat protein [Pirellulaceae bacterium]
RDYGASLPTWGFCGSPLVVGDRVIVQTGVPDASLVCLDLNTGQPIWRSPGKEISYSSFIHVRVHGIDQVVGYDATTLGGWRLEDGLRLWELTPPHPGDFNVGTPLSDGHRLWVATENNGTRIYQFDSQGRIDPTPLAHHADLAPDTQTPIAAGRWILGIWHGLYCLERDTLQQAWHNDDDIYQSYASMVACGHRALLLCREGDLVLIEVDESGYHELGRARVSDQVQDLQSHPALVGRYLIVRLRDSVVCFSLGNLTPAND